LQPGARVSADNLVCVAGDIQGHVQLNYINGTSNSVSSGTTGFSSAVYLFMGNDDSSEPLDGLICVAGFWGSAFSAGNQSAMNGNQRTYYGF
jgi:hypothetical protein